VWPGARVYKARLEFVIPKEKSVEKSDFESALKSVAEFGCAENVDWLFDQYGPGVSRKGLDDAVCAAERGGYPQVARTLRARACMLS
jgi:hypothetical protein